MASLQRGIDVSLAENKAVFLDGTGEDVASRLRFPNNALGSELFLHKTLEICSRLKPERLLFGLEATSLYGWHLAMVLNQAAELAQFHPAVYLLNPRIVRGFNGAAGSALVTDWYSVEDIAAASLETLAQFLVDRSGNKFANPLEVARQIQVAARHSYRLPTAAKGAVNHILASTLRHVRFLEGQLHEVSEAIAHHMKGLDNPLLTIPGLGPVFTAGILSEIGSITNFANDDDLAAFTGLTWNRKQSGPFQGEDSHLSGTGNVYLRYYFVEGANRVRMHDPVFRDYYQRKFKEATIHQHKRALVLTARKLVRVVFALLRDNRPYSPPGKAGSYPQAA